MKGLPKQIQKQEQKANLIQKKLQDDLADNPKRGRPKRELEASPSPCIVGDSEQELDYKMGVVSHLIGPRKAGNKSWAYQALYTDLTQYFIVLHKQGIVLPRKHLSLDACTDNFAEILARHGYLAKCELHTHPLKKVETRKYIANSLARIFTKVANYVEKIPLQ